MRMFLAWVLGLGGLAAVGYGATRPWYEQRPAWELPVTDLVSGVQRDSALLVTSLVIPLGLGIVLAGIGLMRSGGLTQFAGVLLLAIVGVWVLQATDAVPLGDLGAGVWNTAFGSLLVLVAGVLRPSRAAKAPKAG